LFYSLCVFLFTVEDNLMRARPVRLTVVFLSILCGSAPLLAQTRGYHMELSDRTSGWVILVNDSDKPIEAFYFSGQCNALNAGGGAGMQFTYDALENPSTMSGHPGLDGKFLSQRDTVAPKGRMISMTKLVPQQSGCDWKGDISAVIYSDGSYEGDEMIARGIAALRDGIAASVAYWQDKFNRESPEAVDLDAVNTEAQRLTKEDFAKTMFPGCRKSPLACEYWKGRHQVDSNVAMWLRGVALKDTHEEAYKKTAQIIERWQKKIDNNVALKRLDVVFQPQSEEPTPQSDGLRNSPTPPPKQ
jgi:hypothetical protein